MAKGKTETKEETKQKTKAAGKKAGEAAESVWEHTKQIASNPVVTAIVGTAAGVAGTLIAQGYMGASCPGSSS